MGEGEGEMIWENGIEICIISYMKRVASPGSTHDIEIFKKLFIFGYAGLFSSCGEQQCGLLTAVASLVGEHGLKDMWASVVVAHGLSCSAARGIFPSQGSSWCLLHWQVDSLPLRHQRSPQSHIF